MGALKRIYGHSFSFIFSFPPHRSALGKTKSINYHFRKKKKREKNHPRWVWEDAGQSLIGDLLQK